MDLAGEIRQFFERHAIRPCNLLAAVSGGPDSTALLLALTELRQDGFTVSAGHVNHHLRGEASDQDESFVRRLCVQHEVTLFVAEGPLDPKEIRAKGVEAAARQVRYAELHRIREEIGAQFIVTAHHRDDQAETVLMRLITGSGTERLAGIAPITRGGLLRPLLGVSRADLAEFLHDRGVDAQFDSTNAEFRFLRNRIRNELMPLLAEYNPRVTENLASLATQARERKQAFEILLQKLLPEWVKQTPNATEILIEALPDSAWLRRAILWREIRRLAPGTRDVSASDLTRLAESMATLRRTSVTKDLELVRTGNVLTLRSITARPEPFNFTVRPGVAVEVNGMTLRLERHRSPTPPYTDEARTFQTFQLPDGAADESFVIRSRRRGERFQPLGLNQEKKLNEFLIDRKIPRELRDRLPLLTWDDEVVWIAGVEVSEKFKVAEPWRNAYQITIIGNLDPADLHR